MIIAIFPQVVWLAALLLRPGEVVSGAPPFSEAIAVSAISGLVGFLVGAQSVDTNRRTR
jgi:xanthosine utilization system XapX-like protein